MASLVEGYRLSSLWRSPYYGGRHISVKRNVLGSGHDPSDRTLAPRAITAAVKLFRMQGYTATGLSQILEESGAPKGSFYFHFPRGKTQLAEEAIDQYIAARISVLRSISENTWGDALAFVRQLFEHVRGRDGGLRFPIRMPDAKSGQ